MRPILKPHGFSIVEIVVVLLVLGVLAVLITTSLQGVQAKSRDAARRAEIDVIARQLETCYKGPCAHAYPSINQLTDTLEGGFLATHFVAFDPSSLYDSSAGIIQTRTASAATQYRYTTTPADCNGIGNDKPCTGYTLGAYQETNPDNPYIRESFNK